MNEIEKNVKGFFVRNLVISIAFLILGLVLFFYPVVSNTVITYILGSIFISNGISYLLDNPNKILLYNTVLMGVISLIFGIVIFVNPDIVSLVFPIILGIWFIVAGVLKFELANVVNRIGASGWGVLIVTSIFTIFAGVFMLICPKFTSIALTEFAGLFIVFYSVSDIINYIYLRNKINKLVKYFK